ncbi:glycosyltransferase family 39 protein [bacterium]|nr:glycosyltransferase family 39 protein [bacterium]
MAESQTSLLSSGEFPIRPGKIARFEWFLLAGILLVAAVLRLYDPDLSYLSIHTTRDLYRSQLLLRGIEFPLLGSELQYGGRAFGPIMYIISAIPMAFSTSPLGLAIMIGIVNTILLGIVWWFVRRYFGVWPALWTTAVYAAFPLEIAQLRYNWNPCFLPLMSTAALMALFALTIGRKRWHLVTVVLFISLAFQFHFSALHLLVPTIAAIALAKPGIRWKPLAASGALILVLFSPLIIHEITAQEKTVEELVEAPVSGRGALERWSFNPNGPRNFLYHLQLDMYERSALGFEYLSIVPYIGDTWIGPRKMLLAKVINAYGKIQLVFWLAGMGLLGSWIVRYWRMGKESRTDSDRNRMLAGLIMILWQLTPPLALAFFNFHGKAGEPPALIPIRYYVVSYPLPFMTSGLGIVWLAGLGMQWGRALLSRRVVFVLAAGMVASHVVFDILYIQVLERSGRMSVYTRPNCVPNTRTVLAVKDILLGEAGLDRDAYFEHTHTQYFADLFFGETSLDWVISQDTRAWTNPAPDPHLRWLLHSPYFEAPKNIDSPVPEIPEGGTETRRWGIGDTGVSIVEYRVEDPSTPIPDNLWMRNLYFRDMCMLYLGGDKEVRALSRERLAGRCSADSEM